MRVVEGEKEAVGREVIGNHGARVRELERSHRVRVLQEDLGDTTRVVLIGPQDAVDALTASLGTSLQQYADTHFTLRLTPEHFAMRRSSRGLPWNSCALATRSARWL